MIKRGTSNSVLVELEKLSDDEYVFSSGAKLYMNNTFKPENFVRIHGECVAVPEVLTKGDQVKYETGDYRFVDSIEPEVQVGDRVYFNYVSVHKGSLLEYEGKCYCNVPYSAILCVVRDIPEGFEMDVDKALEYCKREGVEFNSLIEQAQNKTLDVDFHIIRHASKQIIPIGGNILCEEYFGKDAEMIEVNGFKIHVNSSGSGLVTNIVKKASDTQARVKIVGKPLKEDNMEVAPGDLITFPSKFGFKNNIEGIDYLFLKYWDIHGILEEETI